MLASFLLSLREGLEAALIIGIVLAALRKMNRTELGAAAWRGVLAAVLLSLLAGLALKAMGAALEGKAEEMFEGIAMLSAAALLTWMIFWMRRQAATFQKDLETDVKRLSARGGSQWGLFWLSFLAVGREGFELVLFLTAVQMTAGAVQTFLGAALGLASAILIGWVFFTSSKRMSLRQFFTVTNLLLILFAAGLAAHGIHEFNEAGIVPPIIEHVWDINPILNEKQPLGMLLTALFGYNANPSLTEVITYTSYLLVVGLLWRGVRKPIPLTQQAA